MFFTHLYLHWRDGTDTPRMTSDQIADCLNPLVEVHRAFSSAGTTNGAVSEDNARQLPLCPS